jgi:Uma2 family endonuclease
MELLIEPVLDEAELSDSYELERNKPMPSKNHGKLQMRIGFEMMSKYRNRFDIISEPTLQIPERPRVPDLAFFKVEKSDWFDDETKITDVPEGVIEILSPSQSEQELANKFPPYFALGIKTVWLVVPIFQTIYVFDAPRSYQTFTIANPILKDTVLDVELDLNKIFA